MKPLKMHSSNFKYVYDLVIDPCSPSCVNCEFMPDNECGWGYDYLDECVFQIQKNTSYILHPNSDFILAEHGRYGIMECGFIKYYDEVRYRIEVISEYESKLSEYIEYSEVIGLNPFWSSDDELNTFYNDSWERRDKVRRITEDKEKDKERGWQYDDYIKWIYKKEPCSQCGKVTSEFLLLGNRGTFRNLPTLKICKGCIGSMNRFCDDEYLLWGD